MVSVCAHAGMPRRVRGTATRHATQVRQSAAHIHRHISKCGAPLHALTFDELFAFGGSVRSRSRGHGPELVLSYTHIMSTFDM
jgi:hypothetical protein